jgi:hypothetical protein
MISAMKHNFLSFMLKDSEEKKGFEGNDMVPSHYANGINLKCSIANKIFQISLLFSIQNYS